MDGKEGVTVTVARLDGLMPYGPQVKPLRVYLGLSLRRVCEIAGFSDIGNLAHWENASGPYKSGGGTSTEVLYPYLRALGVGSVEITANLL